MEEQRIGAMYVNLWIGRVKGLWARLFPRGIRRSPLLPGALLAALLIGPGIGWYLHRKGEFHRVKRKINTELRDNTGMSPGGLDPLAIRRPATPGTKTPEFLSATVLPGMGMTVLQISAFLPGHGETPLLASPSVEAMAQGSMGAPSGVNDDYGAIEEPWGGELTGGMTPAGTMVDVNWNSHTMEVPTDSGGRREVPDIAEGGLLTQTAVDESHAAAVGQALEVQGIFRDTTFAGHWLSKTDSLVKLSMTARAIELDVQAKNTGTVAQPMGIGWHPRFAVVGGPRERIALRLPDGDDLELSTDSTRLPTGKINAASLELKRFQTGPSAIGPAALDETVVNMKPAGGEAVELLDAGAGYGLRLTALSPSIRALRATSPASAPYVSLGMQTNLDDPFGSQWTAANGSGIVRLEPGETLEWKVRLEIFPLTKP